MIDKKQIESLLKVNGVEKTAPDEQIRSVLLSARFKDKEVDTALMVLRENIETKETRVEGLHKVFRTDSALKPSEISNLLGIEVDLEQNIVVTSRRNYELTFLQFVLLWVVSLILAVMAVLSYMYSNNIGVFHPNQTYAADPAETH